MLKQASKRSLVLGLLQPQRQEKATWPQATALGAAGSCWGALGRALTQLGPRRGSPKTTKSTLLELGVCDSDLRETAHPQAVGLRRMSEHPVGWGSRAAAWVSRSHLKAGRQTPMASPPRLASHPRFHFFT